MDLSKDYYPASNRIAVDGTPAGSAEVTVAGDFSVTYHPYFKVLKNLKTSNTYILRMCGSDKPTKYPNGTAIESDAAHFSVPINGAALGWGTPMVFFEQLDLMDKVKLANPKYVHSPCLHKATSASTITVESDGTEFKTKAAAATDVELVIIDSWGTGMCNCTKDVTFDTSSDDTPLGRAEWIKFISVFFNEEDRANLVFAREKAAYEASVKIAESASATHAAANGGKKKKCAWVSNLKVDMHPYKTAYCTDAGMEAFSVTPADTSKTYTDKAALATALADVDVIIDETSAWPNDPCETFTTKATVEAKLGITLKDGALLLRTDRMLYDTGSNKNYAWLESGITRPAHVLQGLVHAVWPTAVHEIPATCVDYWRDITAGETCLIKDETHCDLWETANKENQCVTNIISDDEMALIRDSPAAKPSSIIAIVIALIVAVVGA